MSKIDTYISKVINPLDLDKKEANELKFQFKDHIISLKDEYLEKGYSIDEATDLALKNFGNEHNISEMFNNEKIAFFDNPKKVIISIFCAYLFILFAFLNRVSAFELPRLRFSILNIIPFATLIPLVKYLLYNGPNVNTLIIPCECLWFIPVGVLIPLISSKKTNSFKANLKIYIITVLSIQIIKFVIGIGRGNIDYAIIHLLGCLIGYGFYKVLKAINERIW